jgi:tetratricopeptide (TPR) repeat protein
MSDSELLTAALS